MNEIKDYLSYDPITGEFTWIKSRGGRFARAGTTAGSQTNLGYIVLCFKQQRWLAHRLAWWWVYGVQPPSELDHINGNGLDNRIANLREVNRSENMQNVRGAHKDNVSGYMGVSRSASASGYRAHIQINKKGIHLGSFATAEEAHQAYLAAKRELHPFRREQSSDLTNGVKQSILSTQSTKQDITVLDTEKVVSVFIKMRDRKAEITKRYEAEIAELDAKQAVLQNALLDFCKENKIESIKTSFGTAFRTIKTRLFVSDWQAVEKFIYDNDAFDLLEKRLAQNAAKTWTEENPDKPIPSLVTDSKYCVTIRRGKL